MKEPPWIYIRRESTWRIKTRQTTINCATIHTHARKEEVSRTITRTGYSHHERSCWIVYIIYKKEGGEKVA